MLLRLDDALVATRALPDRANDAVLTPAEHGLVDGAATPRRKAELVAGRAAAHDAFLAAGATSRPSVLHDDAGRPRVDPPIDWCVSLAHDEGLAAAAVARAPIGIDVLAFARAAQAERVVEERLRTGRARGLPSGGARPYPEPMLLWTAWEALGKRHGGGVFAVMQQPIELVAGEGPTAIAGDARVRWFESEGHLLCLAGPLPS